MMKKAKAALIFAVLAAIFAAAAHGEEKKAEKITGMHLEAGLKCADCHNTDKPETKAPQSACIECHDTMADGTPVTFKDGKGVSYTVSPHASHAGQIRCTLCHRAHRPSTLYCNDGGCHHDFILKVP